MDAVGNESLNTDFAVGRTQAYVSSGGDAALGGEFGRYLDEVIWRHGMDAGCATSHGALLEVFKQTTIVEVKIEGLVLFF